MMLAILGEAHKRGLPIVAGTDQAIPGHSLHREMEIYVQSGFTPMEALQAATIVPARVMKLDRELGTLEVGKRADMVLLDADPLQDIHNTRRISKTISGGSVYDPAPLWRSVDFKP
jgi:imidazolonepropionase-like amidohydrolase